MNLTKYKQETIINYNNKEKLLPSLHTTSC